MKPSSLIAAITSSSVGAVTTSAMQSAHHYSDHVTRFTKPHALDLIDVIYHDIVKAKNILEIGCGTGVFGLAYLERFPRGIPGQTIYCTDINPAMVQVAERVVVTDSALPPQQQRMNECATQFIFQPADGTKLDMFEDHTFDIIVSVFGLFLIPDREAALSQVRRVLSNGGGILAMTAWTTTGDNEALWDAGFGANLHDAMSLMRLPKPTETTTTTTAPIAPTIITKPQQILPQHILDWFEPSQVKEILTNNTMFQNVLVHRVIHSVSVPNVEAMWETFSCGGNPSSSNSSEVDEQQQQKEMMMAHQKTILGDYIAMDGNIHRPLFIRTVSNIIVAQ